MSNQYNSELIADMAWLCKPFCGEDNDRLYPLVAASDTDARRRMIEGNMSLAVAKVESLIRCFPEIAHLRADLTSAAFIGLVKAVNKMAAGKGPRSKAPSAPADFIGMWIDRELGRSKEDEDFIRVPHTSKDRGRSEGEEVKAPPVCNTVPERFGTPSYQQELETRDLVESCCICNEERTFVAMHEAGRTLVAIAAAIGKSRASTQRMGKQLQARVERKLEALRDE